MPLYLWTTCIQLGPGFVAVGVLVWHIDRLLRRHDREMAKERLMFVNISERLGMTKKEIAELRGELERRRCELLTTFPKRDSDIPEETIRER